MGLLQDIARAIARIFYAPLFTVVIRDSTARLTQGKAAPAFVQACTDVAHEAGITRGVIWGIKTEVGKRLEFSPSIPAGAHQMLRNAFSAHK